MLAPDEWVEKIKDRKVSLKEAQETAGEELRQKKLNEFLEELRRSALLKKLDLLHACCKPPPNFAPVLNYNYNREDMQAFDDLRHGLVHGDLFGQEVANVSELLAKVQKTCFYLMAMMNERFGLKLNPYFPQWIAEAEQLARKQAQDLGAGDKV